MSEKSAPSNTPTSAILELLDVMRQLRDPAAGCPWDLEQDFNTIAPYTIEEAYEVYEAIAQNDMPNLMEELGDLLFQIVFHAQMAAEKQIFTFEDVVRAIVDKMIFRHPHVFAQNGVLKNSDEVLSQWEKLKAQEKTNRLGAPAESESILDDIPLSLPALTRSLKLQKRAAKVGFDWPNTEQVLDKLAEEIQELHTELKNNNQANIEDEFGDILFNLVNFARRIGIEPEEAMRKANHKFETRFRWLENEIKKTKPLSESNLDEMDALWNEAKKALR